MLLEKQNKLTAIRWDSVNEPVSFVKDESKWRKPRNRELAESFLTREKGLSWLGVKDVPTLLKTLDEGWPEGVAKLEKTKSICKRSGAAICPGLGLRLAVNPEPVSAQSP